METTTPQGKFIQAKDGADKNQEMFVGDCPYKSLTTKQNRQLAARCTRPGGAEEGSMFETCADIALTEDECPLLRSR